MVSVGESAPEFTAPLAHDGVEPTTLSEHLDDAPVVMAFFPGAFTGTCRREMETFEERIGEFESAGATVLGVSVDSPFALSEWRDRLDLSFGLVSDTEKELIEAYDVAMDFADLGYHGVAQRAVFVVGGDGEVTFAWVADDPGEEPEYDEVLAAVESA
jgi:peroxiredoxin